MQSLSVFRSLSLIKPALHYIQPDPNRRREAQRRRRERERLAREKRVPRSMSVIPSFSVLWGCKRDVAHRSLATRCPRSA